MAIIDDGFRFNTWWGIGDAWAAKTTYGTTDSDNNRFYVGGSSTRGRTRLGFTIPTSYTGPTSLIIGMRPDETATISYMRAFLTTNGSISSDADVWASTSILASSYFYSDINCTNRITGETVNWVYCKLTYNFTPGTTYYVGIFPYASSTSIGNTNYNAVWFRGRNAADYLWSRLTYQGTYTVTYNANGGTGTMSPSTVTYNSSFMTRKNAFTRVGYTFNGWNEKADGTGNAWTLSSAGVYESGKSWTWTYTHDITLYAQWKPAKYTLTLKTTTGVASFTGGGTFDSGTLAYSTATASTGYHLTKYIGTTSDGSGTDTWTSCANLTTHQETWQMDADRTITVYADPNYAVLFYYPNGGTLNNSTYLISTGSYPGSIRSTSTEILQTVSYGESADPFNATTFGLTRPGYTFKGWAIATSADGITSTVLDQDTKYAATTYVNYGNKNTNVTNAHNFPCCLYAAWTANTYTIKYNGNGNTGGSTSSSTHTYDSSKALTKNGFTKTGYAFKGWATSASGPVVYMDGQSVKNITSTNGGVINLYAVWVKILIRNDVLPYIRIGSTNQPMMPRIFHNGAWHWYLMNISTETINPDSNAVADTAIVDYAIVQ